MKEAVLPFNRFPEVDTLLGPEMRSTGEVMGIDRTFGLAFAKSQIARGQPRCPTTGTVFLSLADRDKAAGVVAARALRRARLRDRRHARAPRRTSRRIGVPVDHGRREGRRGHRASTRST